MKTSLRRALGVVITACAVLFAMATPAPATVIGVELTGGSITVSKTGQTTENIPVGGGACAPGGFTADISSTSSGTMGVSGLSGTFEFPWKGTIYVAVLTPSTVTTAGTYDHATGVMTSMRFSLRIQLYTRASACTAGTLLCTWGTTLHLSSTNLFSHNVSDTITLTGTGTPLTLSGYCFAPFTVYIGGSVAVSWDSHRTL